MANSTTITIRVSAEAKERLERLARDTRRSRSFLAAEALDRYLERELEIIDGIKRGRADVAAGRVLANEAAFAELTGAIDAVQTERIK